ncbi:MAG: N-acetyl-alpha-D-glucosaminyl L-malate synthase BshA, partial [Blastocatellia bacterium]
EAAACELPVIATRIGGLPEVVSDGETGFLSDVGDVEKMAADVIRLLSDEELRSRMGRRGRELAVERYSTERVIPQYISLYERVIGGVPAAAR